MPRGAKPVFAPAQDQEIAALYRAGKSTYEIGRQYGTSPRPVTAALKRQGVKLRAKIDYTWKPTPENRAEIVRLRNEEGLSVQQIARRVKTGNSAVSSVLREEGIEARFGGLNRRFKGEQVTTIVREYLAGASTTELARAYGGSDTVITNTLRRAGIQLRPKGAAFWTPERLQQVRKLHLLGNSQETIARKIGVSQPAIGNRLRQMGLISRPPAVRRESHPSWNGGRTLTKKGYVRVKLPDEDRHLFPAAPVSGYVLEHRLMMARHLGRPLLPDEEVHHRRSRGENQIAHLELWTTSQPAGQRIGDIVAWATEMLDRYMPEALAPGWQDLPRPGDIA